MDLKQASPNSISRRFINIPALNLAAITGNFHGVAWESLTKNWSGPFYWWCQGTQNNNAAAERHAGQAGMVVQVVQVLHVV